MTEKQCADHPIRVVVQSATVSFTQRNLAEPLILSSGTITMVTEAEVTVEVTANGNQGVGKGSIYLSDLWAWPGNEPSRDIKLDEMKRFCRTLASGLRDLCGVPDHPLEHGLRIHRFAVENEISSKVNSVLARSLCASPFDAAIHDATGIALRMSAMRFYDNPARMECADSILGDASTAIRATISDPRIIMPGWYIAGASTTDDSIRSAVVERGIRNIKMKISGSDTSGDARRTAQVFRTAQAAMNEATTPSTNETNRIGLVVDSNEANTDANSVLTYLEELESLDRESYDALEYLEQPTRRDIETYAYDWNPITKKKPVLVDEGLTDVRLFRVARNQGWSGFALKTCKGHSFVLVAAAWALQNDMCVSLQDLTNPGYSAIHAALLASYLPTINGVELNSWQFTPDANTYWLPRLSKMLVPHEGVHRIERPDAPGLGSSL